MTIRQTVISLETVMNYIREQLFTL